MTNRKEYFVKNILPYIICLLLTVAAQFWVFDLAHTGFQYPLIYNGDDSAPTLYRSYEMKTDLRWFSQDQIGSPEGSNTLDFYAFDLALYAIQFFFALISANYAVGYNLFVIGGVWFNSLASLYALRRLGRTGFSSIAASVLFSLLPYYILRIMAHNYLTYYFTVPVACAVAVELYRGSFSYFPDKSPGTKKKRIVNLIWLLLIGMCGIYYTAFSCLFFLIAGILFAVERRSIKAMRDSISAILTSAAGFLIAAAPSIIYWLGNGMSSVFSSRTHGNLGSETYALKMTTLLLPQSNHRLHVLSQLRYYYEQLFPSSENITSSLGFFFSAGFLLILLYLFRLAASKKDDLMRPVTLFTVAAFLIATQGGLSTFLAMLVPMIRAYNRISVYIAFFCAVSCVIFFDRIMELLRSKAGKATGVISAVLCALIIVCGIYDQAGAFSQSLLKAYNRSDVYERDQAFVDEVVDTAHEADPSDEMVDCYFLPYMNYPENSRDTGGALIGYEPLLLCVHNGDFAVSYGAQNGRGLSNELASVSDLTIEEQTEYVIAEGYDGIIVSVSAMQATGRDDVIEYLTGRFGQPDAGNDVYLFWSVE